MTARESQLTQVLDDQTDAILLIDTTSKDSEPDFSHQRLKFCNQASQKLLQVHTCNDVQASDEVPQVYEKMKESRFICLDANELDQNLNGVPIFRDEETLLNQDMLSLE